MAYRSVVEEIPASLWRAVRGTFDFTGRSTRTDLLVFAIVPQMALGVCLFVLNVFLDLDFDASRRVQDTAGLVLLVPLCALFVRRMHDQDRTGRWVALLLAFLVFAVASDTGNLNVIGITKVDTPWWLDLVFFAVVIQIFAMSLLPPSEGTNRYGPNPRLDGAELPA